MPDPIAIALSGGVDSLVSAALLIDAGHDVMGVHFLTGYESPFSDSTVNSAPLSRTDLADTPAMDGLKSMAARLGIPLKVIDLRAQFQKQVVDYFTRCYQMGLTPNPCLVCNPGIKFGVLFQKAGQIGARALATGHYARIQAGPDGRRRLLRGVDAVKDQSYFLARLTQKQLRCAVLPLGNHTKEQTRRIAARKGLQPVASEESQDICFIKTGTYGDFLQRQPGFASSPGPIQNLQGDVIGRHNGLHLFTIGQRRGINCPAAQPYYVVRLDASRNRLVVGHKTDLLSGHCRVADINWIVEPPGGALDIEVQVRYRHRAVPARLLPEDGTSARIEFQTKQEAVTPGQGAVFYRREEVLGGGWIQ